MADSLVLLLTAPPGEAEPLRRRLEALGFRCLPSDDPEACGAQLVPVMITTPGPGGAPLGVDPALRREGSPLERIPLLVLGDDPDAPGADEVIPPGVSDSLLAARVRAWARWSAMARRPRAVPPSDADPAGRPHPAGSLPGHKMLMEILSTEMKRQERYGSPLGLVLADIDGLREINARYGHRTGDLIISAAAETLRETVRGSDLVFHYAGDTFAILLTHSDAGATRRAIQRLASLVAGRIFRGQAEGSGPQPLLKITMSFGHACLPDAGIDDPGALVAAAEASLAAGRAEASSSAVKPGRS